MEVLFPDCCPEINTDGFQGDIVAAFADISAALEARSSLWEISGSNLNAKTTHAVSIDQYVDSLLLAIGVLVKWNMGLFGGQYLYSAIPESGLIEIINRPGRNSRIEVRLVKILLETGISETRHSVPLPN